MIKFTCDYGGRSVGVSVYNNRDLTESIPIWAHKMHQGDYYEAPMPADPL